MKTFQAILSAIACMMLIATFPASAQQSGAGLVGTWSLVLVDNVAPDGSRVHLYGEDPQGILTFDASGHYALQILRSGRPRFAANDKSKGTAEENQAAVQGSNTHFGTYMVNEKEHTITFSIDHAFFPNWEGTKQTRSFTLTADRFKYIVPTPTTGGNAIGEVEWKRADR
jgi:hypothetical protein